MPYNLVIITPDQLRADYLGCYGHPAIGTSHIDRLAAEGTLFENCYCAAPLCAPSRISFATSTYVGEHGHRNYGSEISPDVPNLVTSLKQAGYRTGMFGKNHLFTYSRLPELWDSLDEICLGNCDEHPDYTKAYSAFTMAPEHRYNITGRLTEETISFMQDSSQPFLAWVNYQDPHPAFACPPPYDRMFDPEQVVVPTSFYHPAADEPHRNRLWRAHSEMDACTENDIRAAIATYMGQVRYIDDSVGRILHALDASGLAENTLVLFFSDHGELLGDHRMTHKLPAFYDSLTRIPAILRLPGQIKSGGRYGGLLEEVDLVPTLLELLDIAIPITMAGHSIAGELVSGAYQGRQDILCEAGGGGPLPEQPVEGLRLKAPSMPTSLGPGAMLRHGNWKLSVYADDSAELFNLENDPGENTNLYGVETYGAVQADLATRLLKRLLSVKMRDIGMDWDFSQFPRDVRFEPLEQQ